MAFYGTLSFEVINTIIISVTDTITTIVNISTTTIIIIIMIIKIIKIIILCFLSVGIFMINVSGPFQFVWGLMKPIMPKKALGKTFVLGGKEASSTLDQEIGLKYIEKAYGGAVEDPFPSESSATDAVLEKYFRAGYWKCA
jgi:hypothetical protein